MKLVDAEKVKAAIAENSDEIKQQSFVMLLQAIDALPAWEPDIEAARDVADMYTDSSGVEARAIVDAAMGRK